MAKTINQISLETTMVIERLLTCKENQVITYDELSTLIRRNAQKEGRGCLITAMRRLLMDKQIYFATVRGIGVKRCNDSQKVEESHSYVQRVRRTARKGAKIAASVHEFDKLPRDVQTRHNTLLSLYGAITQFSSQGKMKALESKVADAQAKLPLKATLEAIGSS